MIRLGTTDDLSRAVEMLRDSRAGAGFDDPQGPSGFVFPFVPACAARLFARYVDAPSMLCLVYEVDDGTVQGLLLAHAFEHDFGPVRLAQERVWWIDPTWRGNAAMRMLDAYERWARVEHCVFAGMAGMGDDPDVAALYLRRGYRAAEKHFLKVL
jgi:hypothetical protein